MAGEGDQSLELRSQTPTHYTQVCSPRPSSSHLVSSSHLELHSSPLESCYSPLESCYSLLESCYSSLELCYSPLEFRSSLLECHSSPPSLTRMATPPRPSLW